MPADSSAGQRPKRTWPRQIVKRPPGSKGFTVIRRRWVVKRSFAWIMKSRRLVRDYEQCSHVAEALILIAASATMLRQWL